MRISKPVCLGVPWAGIQYRGVVEQLVVWVGVPGLDQRVAEYSTVVPIHSVWSSICEGMGYLDWHPISEE